MDKIDDSKTLLGWSIFEDEKLLFNIDTYLAEDSRGNFGIPFIVVKRKVAFDKIVNEYFISSHKNLSQIFDWPITDYFMHNGKPVIYYFEKGPFTNPYKYPKEVVENYFVPNINDNWNRIYNPETGGIFQKK
ncbi:MAG: hypothetical protein ACSHW7_10250 [Patiriisocius sp.]|uniref:hypothetical protein n=1 Tax=Patiriisocius sp. TaxID=2822396 RepID=UPI003EF4D98B